MIGGIILNGLAQAFSNFMSGTGSHLANKAFGESLADKHRYALEQMEQVNKYNVENYEMQRDDQLRYSDPAFIRSRFEKAGLSASLALGNGGMSSPISASIGSSSPAGGLSGSPLAHGTNILESMARIRNLDQDTENKKTEGDFAKESMQTRLDILSSDKLSRILDNEIKAVDALYKEPLTQLTIDKMQAEIDSITRTIANAENLTDIERQRMIAYRDSLVNQNELWKSQIKLNEARTDTEGTIHDLNESMKKYYDVMPERVKADADYITQKANLTEQQAREVKNLIGLRWAQFGVDTAQKISHEAREWMYGWIPLRRNGKKMEVDMDKVREETRKLRNENDEYEMRSEFWK